MTVGIGLSTPRSSARGAIALPYPGTSARTGQERRRYVEEDKIIELTRLVPDALLGGVDQKRAADEEVRCGAWAALGGVNEAAAVRLQRVLADARNKREACLSPHRG